jgi:hypothetical protein
VGGGGGETPPQCDINYFSPTPRAKEGDSYDHGRGFGYDHGRGFIVRILGGLKRETVIAMVGIS